MATIAQELEFYRDTQFKVLTTTVGGHRCSAELRDVLERQLLALQDRYPAGSPKYRFVTSWLEAELDERKLLEMADALMFVAQEVSQWLHTRLYERRELLTVGHLVEQIVQEFKFVCGFDACIVLHALASIGWLQSLHDVRMN